MFVWKGPCLCKKSFSVGNKNTRNVNNTTHHHIQCEHFFHYYSSLFPLKENNNKKKHQQPMRSSQHHCKCLILNGNLFMTSVWFYFLWLNLFSSVTLIFFPVCNFFKIYLSSTTYFILSIYFQILSNAKIFLVMPKIRVKLLFYI